MQVDGISKNKNKIENNLDKRSNKIKTGLDVAEKIKGSILEQYPGLPDAYAMSLAVLLTKEQLKNI